jgi:hypothetical protein
MTTPIRFSLPALLIACLYAESRAERKTVAAGLVGGLTAASFWGEDVKEFDTELWPTVGVTLAFHLPVFLGLEADVLYVNKSGAIRSTEDGRLVVNTIKYHALEIPLLLKVTAPTGNEVMPIFFGGPSVAIPISRKSYSEFIETANGGTVIPTPATPYIEPGNVSEMDWSLCLGGGVEWGLGSIQMRFSTKYS